MSKLLLDTQLVVLLVVGSVDLNLLGTHRRVKAFTAQDFWLLRATITKFAKLLVTPNILTEASNLIEDMKNPKLLPALSRLIAEVDEEYFKSSSAARHKHFNLLGLADCVPLLLGRTRWILTDDLDLFLTAQREGMSAMNFNHLRENPAVYDGLI